jgi:quercetin dioxygenase-like cupin family protein
MTIASTINGRPANIAMMRSMTTAMLLLATLAAASFAAAQTPPATTRTVIAATKLPTVTDVPRHFRLVSVTLPPGEKSSASGADGVLYQVSGSTEVSACSDTKVLNGAEGIFIAGGQACEVKAGGAEPSVFLHFLLAPAAELDRLTAPPPATVKELYRTPAPIPDLRAGGYDLNLTRVTFPAKMPLNAPHHRSGAALYYVISGTGANTIGGQTIDRGPGALIYEPYDLVHQWGNPGDTPLTFLTFNINPEGVQAVLPGAPAPRQ